MGILRFVSDRGVFPRVDEPALATRAETESLSTGLEGWENYQSFEEAPGICADILNRMVQQGWAWSFRDHAEATAHHRASQVVLKLLGLITKMCGAGLRSTALFCF